MLLMSCSDELGTRKSVVSDSCEIVIPFSIDKSSGTRSGEQIFDETVDHVYLLFFSDENPSPDTVFRVTVDNSDRLSFTLPSTLEADTIYKLIAIANADEYVPSKFKNFSEYVKSVSALSEICLFRSGSIVSSFATSSTTETNSSQLCGVPMKAADNFSFTKSDGDITVTKGDKLIFYRLVSRIDVYNSSESITIEGIAMCNWRDSGYIEDSATLPGNICGVLRDEGSNESGNSANSLQFVSPIKDDSGSQSLTGALYCFPSAAKTSAKGDENTTALIIKARYNDESTYCYYRINLGVSKNSSELKANTKYSINIKDVSSKGFPTPEEAYAATADEPYVPVYPDTPVALVPLSNEHLISVDHDKREIVIDGFAPEKFNSFIDIPLEVYIKDPNTNPTIVVKNDDINNHLRWPLEGRISMDTSEEYFYCKKSFTDGSVMNAESKTFSYDELKNMGEMTLRNGEKLFLSVGAMAPDDPEIERKIWMKIPKEPMPESFYYTIKIRPRPAIIDDVILFDANSNPWLVMDRNVQDLTATGSEKVGRNGDYKKRQAYHYCHWEDMKIPFKLKDAENQFNESLHTLFRGKYHKNTTYSSLIYDVNTWMSKYLYSDIVPSEKKNSLFYDSSDGWILPDKTLLEFSKSKMKVSKMRMFLVSDVPVIDEKENSIPVCCYLPYMNTNNTVGDTSNSTFGYFYAENGELSLMLIYCNITNIGQYIPSSLKDYRGFSRIVRSLSDEELRNYKNNFLGYGSPHKQTLCHPDTYTSSSLGWTE